MAAELTQEGLEMLQRLLNSGLSKLENEQLQQASQDAFDRNEVAFVDLKAEIQIDVMFLIAYLTLVRTANLIPVNFILYGIPVRDIAGNLVARLNTKYGNRAAYFEVIYEMVGLIKEYRQN